MNTNKEVGFTGEIWLERGQMMYHRAWIEGAWRLVLDQREIRRGKNKGKLQVTYRSTATLLRKTILALDKLVVVNTNP